MEHLASAKDRIALLATGDELVNGDILNTNGQYIAQLLLENGLTPGQHLVVDDDEQAIIEAIQYLLSNHAALITIGGLGPTSDDRTRFALAAAIDKQLMFDDPSWQSIINRLQALSLEVPETNKQQCYFPQGAQILANNNGTANACRTEFHGKPIFMLPGPPTEMRPIVARDVIPFLAATPLAATRYHQHWMLLGASEGTLAAQLDPIAEKHDCQIGYRVDYPYLELKVFSRDKPKFDQFVSSIKPYVEHISVSDRKLKASQQLRALIADFSGNIAIQDCATQGVLAYRLLNPSNIQHVTIDSHSPASADLQITITGLESYWQQSDKSSNFHISYDYQGHKQQITKQFDLRGQRTLLLASELICWELVKLIRAYTSNA